MKNRNKVIAMLMATAMLTTGLTGCGSDSGQAQAGGNETAAGTPHFNITAVLNTATEDLNDNPLYQEMAKAAGVDISYEGVSSGWSDKKAAMLAGNDLPDAFIGWRVLTPQEISNNTSLFTDLSEYITEENTPNLKAFIDSNETFRNTVTDLEGHIYFLSDQALFRPATYQAYQMNMDWLEKLNLEVPETLDEFEEVLKAFRDKDPNGNGEADEMPLYIQPPFDCLKGSFDCQGSLSYDGNFRVEDGKIVFLPATDNYREFMNYVVHLREERLIPEEVATADWSQIAARMGNDIPIVGMVDCWIKDPLNVEYQDQYDAILPLEGPHGARYMPGNQNYSSYDGMPKFVMSATCENKEALMRFVDQFFIPINSAQLSRGPIGLTLSQGEDGKLTFNDPPEGVDWDTWLYKYALKESIPTMGGEAVESLFTAPDAASCMKMEFDAKYQPYINKDIELPILKFTEEESAELSMIQTDITDYVNTTIAGWFVNGGVDEGWDAYLAEMENMQLTRMVEIFQTAYDRQVK